MRRPSLATGPRSEALPLLGFRAQRPPSALPIVQGVGRTVGYRSHGALGEQFIVAGLSGNLGWVW